MIIDVALGIVLGVFILAAIILIFALIIKNLEFVVVALGAGFLILIFIGLLWAALILQHKTAIDILAFVIIIILYFMFRSNKAEENNSHLSDNEQNKKNEAD